MRIVVGLDEEGYLDWRRRLGAVLAAVGELNPSGGHVLVRTGSLIDRTGFLERQWATSKTTDDRAAILSATRRINVGAVYLEGVAIAAVTPFLDRVRDLDGFLGFVDVTTEPRTALLLQNTLPRRFRLVGSSARVLHIFAELEGDMAEADQTRDWLDQLGAFQAVTLEDIGVRDTIFDISSMDMARALRVNEIVALATNIEHAEAAVLWLDVIDFRLTEALHAAARTCSSAEYSEEAAQGALSCRRFLEQLADVLFPPGANRGDGRLVRAQDWKNRLWAAIDEALGPEAGTTELARLGALVDDIKEAADKGVHQHPPISPQDAVQLIEALLTWLYELARIMPPPAASSLEPYRAGILETLRELFQEE